VEHFDVVIVGAGLSGIGAAFHLQERCPGKSYAILEGRDAIGGTWDLFRYPGIRSDSDMHTLGYSFKPWLEAKAIADGPSIRKYVNETADENEIRDNIRFNHLVQDAAWSTEHATWTVTSFNKATNETVRYRCNFLYMCSGYYNYDEAYTPEFEGIEDFSGTVVHPQFWPEDLDYSGKKVVVIGSGATAMTIVPAMADKVESITMLQRSPTYVVSRPAEDKMANTFRKYLPEKLAYGLTRFKNVELGRIMYNRTRTQPAKVKKIILDMVRKELKPDYDVDKHFTPSYNPWDQRLCLVPDSDLFKAINSGKAIVVTEKIDSITSHGIKLESGEVLPADIIVTATGLNMKVLGGATLSVDGKPVDFPSKFSYKGMMYSDVPNLVQTFGYINASWTLRADINSEFVCRLLNRMDELGVRQATPIIRQEDHNMPAKPWVDDFSAGYMQRMMHLFPKQSDRDPWRNTQNYALDKKLIRKAPLEDGTLIFGNSQQEASLKKKHPPAPGEAQDRTAA
jgi:cation diffusion facilitator CzcD-associated flavoprotein CzcO